MHLWFIFQAPLLAESIDRQPLKNIKPNLDWREVAYTIKARPVNQYYNCGHTPEGLPEAIANFFTATGAETPIQAVLLLLNPETSPVLLFKKGEY